MKQLKDYIHFYIGCEVVRFNGRIGLHITGILVGVTTGYLLVKGGYATARVEFDEDTRLVLRRLESMTEDQENYYDSRMDDAYISHDMEAIAIIINDLIAEGYDCHGLIDAGLAIDAETLTQK